MRQIVLSHIYKKLLYLQTNEQKFTIESSDGILIDVDFDVAMLFKAFDKVFLRYPNQTCKLEKVDSASLTMVIWLVNFPRAG